MRALFFDWRVAAELEALRPELVKLIEGAERDPNSNNPITIAYELKALRDSKIPQDQQLSRVLDELASLREQVRQREEPNRLRNASDIMRQNQRLANPPDLGGPD